MKSSDLTNEICYHPFTNKTIETQKVNMICPTPNNHGIIKTVFQVEYLNTENS